MIRSMFTAISALDLHQKFLDVVSNNLANANTTGYKANRVLFQDQYAQTLSPGAAPSTTIGGTNPTQIGLGVLLGYVSPNFTQGMLQSTGRNMDLGIQGDGFFIYGNQTNGRSFSREGSMSLDANGFLVDSATGARTQGWTVPAGATTVDTNLPVDDIKISTDNTQAQVTKNVVLGGNLTSTVAAPVVNPTISLGVYDSLGKLQTGTITFTRGATTGASPNIQTAWGWALTGAAGTAGAGTINFDQSGQYIAPATIGGDTTTPVTIPGSTGAGAVTPVAIDFSKLTMLASPGSAAVTSQDGLPSGTVSDVFISPNDGVISLVYTNGLRSQVGQLALARFTNPTGLFRGAHTTFQAGLNSGEPEIGTANSGGRGSISSGYLEASNVDMAQEFTNMILAQRGFQASSRVITTSDEILQELVNLKR